jgi:hypothetical protein
MSEVADVLKLNPKVVGKVFGSLLVEPGRYDIGLNLRYKTNFCVIGYTQYVVQIQKKKEATKEKAAWTPGDAVRVLGSHTTTLQASEENEFTGVEEGYWQYTPKVCNLSLCWVYLLLLFFFFLVILTHFSFAGV